MYFIVKGRGLAAGVIKVGRAGRSLLSSGDYQNMLHMNQALFLDCCALCVQYI